MAAVKVLQRRGTRARMPRTLDAVAWIALALVLVTIASPSLCRADDDREGVNRNIPLAEDPDIAKAKLAIRSRDFDRALKLWKMAANRGNSEGAYRLGVAYRSGTGVDKDNRVAARWFSTAAEGGHHGAQFALGVFHQNGIGMPPDRDEAIRLYGLAARGGNRSAEKRLKEIQSTAYAAADARVTVNRNDPREALAQAIRTGDEGAALEALSRGAPIDGAKNDTKKWRPLILAIDRGDDKIVALLLKHRANPNVQSRAGEPALVLAIRKGDRAIVRKLLNAQASPNRRAVSGYTPLMEAARLGSRSLVNDLLSAGADPKETLSDGTSGAGVARRFGHSALSRELKKRGAPTVAGADPNARKRVLAVREAANANSSPSLPPVVEAARRGDVDLLKEMVSRGIDLSVKDPGGSDALTRAAEQGHVAAVRVLLGAGLAPDSRGIQGATPLMSAFASDKNGTEDTVALLLESGADPHVRDTSGRALIDYAASGATSRKIKLVKDAGGSWTPAASRAALATAAAAGRLGVVDALLGIVTAKAAQGIAVCRAVEQKESAVFERLVKAGAALNENCGEGKTPIAVAAHRGDEKFLRRLVDSGAELNTGGGASDTPLIAAASNGHAQSVTLLLEKGADIDGRGLHRMTALMAAALRGDAKTIEVLLNAGADRGKRNDARLTALDLAKQTGKPQSAALIEEFRPGWKKWLGSAGE